MEIWSVTFSWGREVKPDVYRFGYNDNDNYKLSWQDNQKYSVFEKILLFLFTIKLKDFFWGPENRYTISIAGHRED